MKIEVNIPS